MKEYCAGRREDQAFSGRRSARRPIRQPGGDAKQRQADVTKMVKVFGAPIRPQDEKTIVEYLSSAYGPAK